MGWSWTQFEDTPKWVVDVLLEQIESDRVKREAEDQRREQEAKRKHRRVL